MSSARPSSPGIQLFSQPKPNQNQKTDKTLIQYDLRFPIGFPEDSKFGSITNGMSSRFDHGSFRQPAADYCFCLSKDKLKDFCMSNHIEPHGLARSWKKNALDLAEFPLHALNNWTFNHCYYMEQDTGCFKASKCCLDISCCLCVCCTVRIPTYVVKSACCCIAGTAGKIADSLCSDIKSTAPDIQSMEDLTHLIKKRRKKYETSTGFLLASGYDIKHENGEGRWIKNATVEVNKQDTDFDDDLIVEPSKNEIYKQEIMKIFRRFLQEKDYRDDLAAPYGWKDRMYREDLLFAVIEYNGKEKLSIHERIQILAYMWERGTDLTDFCYYHRRMIYLALLTNYSGSCKILDFILSKTPPAYIDSFKNYVKDNETPNKVLGLYLDASYIINPQQSRLKAHILLKYNIITERVTALANEYTNWLETKTAFEMGRHKRLGKSSKLFNLPREISTKVLEFYDGINRLRNSN